MKTVVVTFLPLCSTPISALFQPPKRPLSSPYVLPDSLSAALSDGRKLQNTTNSSGVTACSLCEDFILFPDVIPFYDSSGLDIEANLTCANFAAFAEDLGNEECTQLRGLALECCENPPLYECDQRIRRALLADFDSVTPPVISDFDPLVISVNLIYHSVTELDVQSGTAQIFVWLDLTWIDPRLAWDISASNCSQVISVRASLNAEITEIWVPDFDLYNVASGVQGFPDAVADVYSDGTVYWRRAGALRAICQFSGLAQIPFDTLGCQFLLGPWNRIGFGHVSYELANGVGLEYGDFEPTYNEFKLIPEKSETGAAIEGALLFYTFHFRRARNYYVTNIVVPTIILTYVSFGTFLLDLRVGERLSYGMSLALVVVAQQIVTADLIPVSDEYLWIDKFVGWSFYWVIFGLVESVLVGYLYFIREDTSRQQAQANESTEGDDLRQNEDTSTRLEPSSGPRTAQSGQDAETEGVPEQTFRQQLMRSKRQHKWIPVVHIPQWLKAYPLRKIDHFFFFFTTVTYSIYLIVMFATVESFGKGIDPVYETAASSEL